MGFFQAGMSELHADFLRLCSDVHLNYDNGQDFWLPKEMPSDSSTVLLMLGDTWTIPKHFDINGRSWVYELSQRFKYVIFVLGNNDLLSNDINKAYDKFKFSLAKNNLKNVFLLQNESIEFTAFTIAGATFWADFAKNNKDCLNYYREREERWLREGFRDLTKDNGKMLMPERLYNEHLKSKEFFLSLSKVENKKLIIATHYPPSHNSIQEEYMAKKYEHSIGINCADLTAHLEQSFIDFWFHGHTHFPVDYDLCGTRIISNPRRCSHGKYNEDWLLCAKSWQLKNIF